MALSLDTATQQVQVIDFIYILYTKIQVYCLVIAGAIKRYLQTRKADSGRKSA